MTTHRYPQPGSGATPHPAPELSWRDLDTLDRSWSGITYVRSLLDLDVPPVDDLRRALAELALQAAEIGRWVTVPRWRPVAPAELDDWLSQVLVVSDETGVDAERSFALNAAPLDHTAFRLVVGPDWIGVRMNHAMADGWTVNTFLGHLLRRATTPGPPIALPWTVFTQRRRDRLIAGDVVRHARTLAWALRHRAELAGGVYEPAELHAGRLPDLSLMIPSGAGFTATLREVRDELFPGTSAATVAMAGLRAAFATTLPTARAGFECLFNTRSAEQGTADAWGNWSAGVYIRPSDDLSPVAIADEITRVRASGLPQLGHASLRVRGRNADPDSVSMPRPEGSPRLTMSYTQGHQLAAAVPGLRQGRSTLATLTRPNGVDSVTIQAVECAGQLCVGVSFFPDSWPADAVRGAIERFLADPRAVLTAVTGPGRR